MAPVTAKNGFLELVETFFGKRRRICKYNEAEKVRESGSVWEKMPGLQQKSQNDFLRDDDRFGCPRCNSVRVKVALAIWRLC